MTMDEFKIGALYLAVFAAAAMPGPCAVFAASRTASGGIRAGVLVSFGVLIGAAFVTAAAFAVLLGLLAVSQAILEATKWIGVLVLLVLACLTLPASRRRRRCGPERRATAGADLPAGALLVLTSPGALVFLLAMLPQFISDGAAIEPALVAAGLFVAGAAAVQAGAVAVGACSLRLGATNARRVEYGCASLLFACAGLAAFT
jgi:threonine/homoserine/homoserine lactone efflux protein